MDDLVHRSPDEIRNQTDNLLRAFGKDGGYIMSSSNSLTDDMKPENVFAIKQALDNF